jgi:hypothetical protein
MSRPRDEPPPRRRDPEKDRGTPLVTLQQLRNQSCWWWLVCGGCMHFQPAAIVPLIIRWGPQEEVDRLRRSAQCGLCGHKGATLSMPSWMGSHVGNAPWPARFTPASEPERPTQG